MEFAQGGQVMHIDAETGKSDRIFSLTQAATFIRHIAEGLKHLHDHGFVHHDLKPENILLDSRGHIKIVDFEDSIPFSDPTNDLIYASEHRSAAYFPPESFGLRAGYHGMLADVWGIGIIAFCMIFGRLPFWGANRYRLMESVLRAPLKFPFPVPPLVQHFLYHVLDKDPQKRLTVTQILRHPWIVSPHFFGAPTGMPHPPPTPSFPLPPLPTSPKSRESPAFIATVQDKKEKSASLPPQEVIPRSPNPPLNPSAFSKHHRRRSASYVIEWIPNGSSQF